MTDQPTTDRHLVLEVHRHRQTRFPMVLLACGGDLERLDNVRHSLIDVEVTCEACKAANARRLAAF